MCVWPCGWTETSLSVYHVREITRKRKVGDTLHPEISFLEGTRLLFTSAKFLINMALLNPEIWSQII